MKIVYLSPHKGLAEFIKSYGDEVLTITGSFTADLNGDFLISYDSEVTEEIIERFNGNAIGLKTAYLPWNRGADSNFWSFVEDTPKGVTVCFLNGHETGDIIAQRYMKFDYDTDTLGSFEDKLSSCLEDLFQKTWHYIREGNAKRYPQSSEHSPEDKKKWDFVLTQGKDTPVKDIIRSVKIEQNNT